MSYFIKNNDVFINKNGLSLSTRKARRYLQEHRTQEKEPIIDRLSHKKSLESWLSELQ
jgi:hypothetical protein